MDDNMANAVDEVLGLVLGAHVREQTSMDTCPAWDSLKHIEIIMTLEDTFGISFAPGDIPLMTSRKALLDKIRELHGPPR